MSNNWFLRFWLKCNLLWAFRYVATPTLPIVALSAPPEQRPWTVETSVEARYIVEADERFSMQSDGGNVGFSQARPICPSPDGSKFAVLLRHGDLVNDENVFELRIYNTNTTSVAVAAGIPPPAPLNSLIRRSRSNEPGVRAIAWAADGESLRFQESNAGENGLPPSNANYSYDLSSGAVNFLCNGAAPSGRGYAPGLVDVNRDAALYLEAERASAPSETPPTYPTTTWDASRFARLFYGQEKMASVQGVSLVYREKGKVRVIAQWPIREAATYISGNISPDGKRAILALPFEPGKAPDVKRYDGGAETEALRTFMLIDLSSGILEPLLDAPTGRVTQMGQRTFPEVFPTAIWSPDGDTAILVNTALPWDDSEGARTTSWIVAYHFPTRKWQKLAPLRDGARMMLSVRWGDGPKELLVTWRMRGLKSGDAPKDQGEIFSFEGKKWKKMDGNFQAESPRIVWREPRSQSDLLRAQSLSRNVSAGDSSLDIPGPQTYYCSTGLSLTLDESPNEPQQLVAAVGDRKTTLIDRDPSLVGLRISESRIFEWRTPDDRLHRGVLTLPHPTDRPPPLVFMNYSYMPNVFRPDGYCFSGFARQALAARGLAVLEISNFDYRPADETIPPEELDNIAAMANSAVDRLCHDHLVDANRVGMIGFSRGGFQARSMLIGRLQYPIRATVANDSALLSFADLSAWKASGTSDEAITVNYLQRYGGNYWEVPSRWNEMAIDLAANRATGAHLEILHSEKRNGLGRGFTMFLYLDVVGSLLSARRPVDFIEITGSRHVTELPRQRYASLAANVDWMDFWLQDHERTEPCAAAGETQEMLTEKYTRWRKMKVDWERQQAWEAAGNPAGSTPARDFKVPEKNPEEKKPGASRFQELKSMRQPSPNPIPTTAGKD